MNVVESLIERLKRFDEAAQEEALLKIIDARQSTLLDENTSQLFSGVDSKDQQLPPYRSSAYAAFKETLNPVGVTDLKLTGSFYQGFFVDATQFPIKISSNDEKTEKLEGLYGEDIFGLNEEHLENFRQDILSDVQEHYARILEV